jgi:hypothetical protein
VEVDLTLSRRPPVARGGAGEYLCLWTHFHMEVWLLLIASSLILLIGSLSAPFLLR